MAPTAFQGITLSLTLFSLKQEVLEPALEPQQQQPQQEKTEQIQTPGFAGDTIGCQLQPNWEAIREYESGSSHGKLDAANGLEPNGTKIR